MNALGTRRLLAHLVLALLLLCSQVLAIHHGLSHAVVATQVHAPSASDQPASGHCDECDGLIAFDAMLTADAVATRWPALIDQTQPTARMPTAPRAAALPVYRSRAPPRRA